MTGDRRLFEDYSELRSKRIHPRWSIERPNPAGAARRGFHAGDPL